VLAIFAFLESTFCIILFLWSYFAAMCMDPGFLPYTWVTTQKTQYTWQEQLSGLAIHSDQIQFAKSHKPPFASFSKQSGRFVIRADHICIWIANWVGQRNHKQFTLLLVWGLASALSLHGWCLLADPPKTFSRFFVAMICLTFAFSFFTFLVILGWDMCHNQTQIERWDGRGEGRNGVRGCRAVFGRDPLYMWCIPTPAFGPNPFL
jgi:hypothetical protein